MAREVGGVPPDAQEPGGLRGGGAARRPTARRRRLRPGRHRDGRPEELRGVRPSEAGVGPELSRTRPVPLGPRLRDPGRHGLRRGRLRPPSEHAGGGGLDGDALQLRGLRSAGGRVGAVSASPDRPGGRPARRPRPAPVRGRRRLRRRLRAGRDALQRRALRHEDEGLDAPARQARRPQDHSGGCGPGRAADPGHGRRAVPRLGGGLQGAQGARRRRRPAARPRERRLRRGVARRLRRRSSSARRRGRGRAAEGGAGHGRGAHGLPGSVDEASGAGQGVPAVHKAVRRGGRGREWGRGLGVGIAPRAAIQSHPLLRRRGGRLEVRQRRPGDTNSKDGDGSLPGAWTGVWTHVVKPSPARHCRELIC
mmetsp:Transcript_76250/g.200034  ORF Transcript_76250/g.200034 Transcript_76250/m.200034 type:complete len:366 (-) Transcript_76250:157-1254(-)